MSFPVRSLAPAGLTADFVPLDSGVSRFELTIELSPVTAGSHNGEFAAVYDYDSDLFDAPTISLMHEHFDHLLRAIVANLSCPIDDLPLIGQTEQYRLLAEWNNTSLPHDHARCAHHLLESSARLTPDAFAVIAGSVAVDYRMLDTSANRLAHLLGLQGVGRGSLAAVCLERTVDLPVVLAAVLKAGAAYVPLDPTHPEERLHYILEDAEVSCVITTSSLRPIFARLASLIDAHEITVLQATPASWRLLLESGWVGIRKLKALCGGEALPADLAAALVDRTAELWNMYGPTETTIWSTVGRVSDATETITIGRPIANTQTFVLETSGRLAPAGVIGELCIGGEGVARGYRKRPELTAEKFVSTPLPDDRTVRLYRTGDLARFRSNGELELVGRRDFEVKVRGYRVELGEIEAVLMAAPA
jgi:non-ribosomal peptide synthetase component F